MDNGDFMEATLNTSFDRNGIRQPYIVTTENDGMNRLSMLSGHLLIGPALQIAEGWSVDLPDDVRDVLDQRTNSTWPTTWFVPRTNGKGSFRVVHRHEQLVRQS